MTFAHCYRVRSLKVYCSFSPILASLYFICSNVCINKDNYHYVRGRSLAHYISASYMFRHVILNRGHSFIELTSLLILWTTPTLLFDGLIMTETIIVAHLHEMSRMLAPYKLRKWAICMIWTNNSDFLSNFDVLKPRIIILRPETGSTAYLGFYPFLKNVEKSPPVKFCK